MALRLNVLRFGQFGYKVGPLSFFIRLSSTRSLGAYDVVVIGGGIVGMAAARQIKLQAPKLKCALLEKESALAIHQSGNNSGVIHAGIYYKPGSMRAKLCNEGLKLIYKYCAQNSVPYNKCGKIILATNCIEVERLDELFHRGQENNVPGLIFLERKDICRYEPSASGLRAILSPHTGIIDYAELTRSFGNDFKRMGGDIHFCFEVCGFDISPESNNDSPNINKYPVMVLGKENKSVNASFILSCTGLQSAKVAALSGGSPVPAIIPFRGEYLKLSDQRKGTIKGLIYPVPDPRFPFLGVHFTPTIHGEVLVGPNAILALKREGYNMTDFSIEDVMDYFKYKGFRKLVRKHFRYGAEEWLNSLFIKRQLKHIQKLVPCINMKDLSRGPAGVRAQAVSLDGELVEDFVFDSGTGAAKERILHCRNAPSPAATSSMAIANILADEVLKKMAAPLEQIKVNVL